ncbi:MAG: hypothetical protein QM770_10905 [Tepidisphaeraceae bacterium]
MAGAGIILCNCGCWSTRCSFDTTTGTGVTYPCSIMATPTWVTLPTSTYTPWFAADYGGACEAYWKRWRFDATRSFDATSARLFRVIDSNLTELTGDTIGPNNRARTTYKGWIPTYRIVTATAEYGDVVDLNDFRGPENASQPSVFPRAASYVEPNYGTFGIINGPFGPFLAAKSSFGTTEFGTNLRAAPGGPFLTEIEIEYDPLAACCYDYRAPGAFSCNFEEWSGGVRSKGIRFSGLTLTNDAASPAAFNDYTFRATTATAEVWTTSGGGSWQTNKTATVTTTVDPVAGTWSLTVSSSFNSTTITRTITGTCSGYTFDDTSDPTNKPVNQASLSISAYTPCNGVRRTRIGSGHGLIARDPIACGDATIVSDKASVWLALGNQYLGEKPVETFTLARDPHWETFFPFPATTDYCGHALVSPGPAGTFNSAGPSGIANFGVPGPEIASSVAITWEASPSYCATLTYSDSRGVVKRMVNLAVDTLGVFWFEIGGGVRAKSNTAHVPIGAYTKYGTADAALTSVSVAEGPCS